MTAEIKPLEIADALEVCDWSGNPIGNKVLLRAAVQALRATPSHTTDTAGLVDELRMIGCHQNGDARCTCGIGMDAADALSALRAENERANAANEALAEDVSALRAENERLTGKVYRREKWLESWKVRAEAAEAERDRLQAEVARLTKAARDIVRLMNIHPQGRDMSWHQHFGRAVTELEAALTQKEPRT